MTGGERDPPERRAANPDFSYRLWAQFRPNGNLPGDPPGNLECSRTSASLTGSDGGTSTCVSKFLPEGVKAVFS